MGIVVGIAAVIVGVALGNGVQAFFDRLVGPLVTEITVTKTAGQAAGAAAPRDLTDEDAAALRDPSAAPDIRSVTTVVSGSAVLRSASQERRVTVLGSTAEYFEVTGRALAAGRFANLAGGAGTREAVLGPVPVRDLFHGDAAAAVGRQVRLSRTIFTVVGVLTSNSQQDDVAVVGVAAARASLFGNDSTVDQIIVQARSAASVDLATEQIGAITPATLLDGTSTCCRCRA